MNITDNDILDKFKLILIKCMFDFCALTKEFFNLMTKSTVW